MRLAEEMSGTWRKGRPDYPVAVSSAALSSAFMWKEEDRADENVCLAKCVFSQKLENAVWFVSAAAGEEKS